MKHNKRGILVSINQARLIKSVLSLAVIASLTACDVDSISVTDENLIATFLVQNDNGQASATASFASRDLAGNNVVNLIANESIRYHQDGEGGELQKDRDGEYAASLPSTAAGLYSFTLIRELESGGQFTREITDNHVFLPDSFQSLQAEPLQFGPVINLSWALDGNSLQSIDGFIIGNSEDTFNSLAICQLESGPIGLAITEGRFAQQNGMSLLEIPVTEYLQQEANLSAAAIATASCEFDVQLVRTVIGVTDISLDRRSSTSGKVLQNVTIQWTSQ